MQRHHIQCLAWVALVCTVLGCGGSSGGSSPTAPTSVVTPTPTITHHSIAATPSSTLEIGEITTLFIIAHYSSGTTISSPATCNPESGQSLTITADCVLTAVGEGSGTFNLSSPSGSISITITVLAKCCTVAGWVGGFRVGGWLANATVRIGSTGIATTNSSGRFELEIDESGILPVVIEASGFYKSEGYLDVNLGKRTTISGVKAVHALRYLLPNNATSYFDMNFYNHVFRNKGTRGTRRWATMPTVEIFTKQMECLETKNNEGKFCNKYKATSTATPSAFESSIRRVVNEDFSRLTDDVLSGVSITTTSHSPGTIISVAPCASPSKISIAYMTKGSSNFIVSGGTTYSVSYSCRYASGEIRGVDLIMNEDHLSLHHVYVHEFAHGLGWRHPDGIPAVPRPSIMSSTDTISNGDIWSGKVLYKLRPAGSMSLDKDPAGNTMNYPTETRVFDFYGPTMHTGLEMVPTVMAPNLFADVPAFPLGQGLFQGPLIEEIDY
jgi:hypothetical protein